MINAKEIVKKLKGDETDKGSKNYYLDKNLVKSFEETCVKAGLKSSPVIEELMRAFIDSFKESKPKAIKPKASRRKVIS